MLERLLARLTRFLLRHRAAVLLLWLLPAPLLAWNAVRVGERLKSIIGSRNGAQSEKVSGLLAREFPRQAQFVAELTFHHPTQTVDDSPFRASLDAVHAAVRKLPCVKLLTIWPDLPLRTNFVSPDNHTQLSLVEINARPNDFSAAEDCVVDLRRTTAALQGRLPLADLELYVTGAPAVDLDIGRLVRADSLRAEMIVAVLALVLLVWMFRSAAAAFLPLLTAGLALSVCLSVVYVAAAYVRLSVYVSTVATMTGLALGLDYALLYVMRFREEREAGRSPEDALLATAVTAGKAILGSGGLVIVGFAGLLLPDLDLSRSIGLGGMLTVACTLLSTLTLLPVLLSLLHRRLDWPRWDWFRASHAAVDRFWERWSALVLRRPVGPVLLGLALVALCAPHLAALRVQNPRHEVIPHTVEARRGVDRLLEIADEGDLYPILVVVELPAGATFRDPVHQQEFLSLLARLRAWPEVGKVQSADLLMSLGVDIMGLRLGYGFGDGFAGRFVGRDGRFASLNVLARRSDDPSLSALVVRLRTELPALLAASSGTKAWVGGAPARDWETKLALLDALPTMIPVVALAAFVLLALLFRSLVVPLKALALNAASLATTYGILVLVFQRGWGLGLLGIAGPAPGGLTFITPVLLFCILFGVSMDYEVFLVSRIQEGYRRATNERSTAAEREAAHREAIRQGLARTGGIISNAALITVLTFAAFLSGSLLPMKEMGFALALAVALDATLVRMMLVPALLRVLGRRTWYWPFRRRETPGGGTTARPPSATPRE
jgi:RND superfamily putative drug exporter